MRRLMLLGLIMVAAGFASSQVVKFEGCWGEHSLMNLESQTRAGVEIVFSMPEMVIEEQMIDGVSMSAYGVPAVFLPDPGMPNLGGVSRWLALPQGAEARVVILDSRTEVYQNVEVAPAPNIPADNDDAPLKYMKNDAIYDKNAYWPRSPVVTAQKTDLRGVDVVMLSVLPFQYNPVTKELIVYKDIRFRVDFVGGNGHFGDDRLRSRLWDPILENNLLNFATLPKIDFYSSERMNRRAGFEYIIIVPDDATFIAWGDTLKRWRKLQGISTEVYTTTQCGGNDSAHIKSFLQNAYNTWNPAPVAFLILSDFNPSGDVYGVAVTRLILLGETVASDNWYADMNSNNLPDMDHGRICAQNNVQLDTIIHKMLYMERTPTTNASFYSNPIVAAAWQTERWFQLAGEVVRQFNINGLGKTPVRLYAIYSGTPTVGCAWSSRQGTRAVVQYWHNLGWLPDTLNQGNSAWWSTGNNTAITNAINAGSWFVQHRDHGGENLWGEPAYSNSDILNLTNGNGMFPYVNSSNCLTGKYIWTSECMTERFHRDTHGAVGINGASEVSYSFVNDAYIWGIWDGLFPKFDPAYPNYDLVGHHNLRPCQAMTHGKIYLHTMWFADSAGLGTGGYREITDHLFHHHGDCFMTLYSVVPMTLSVSHASVLTAGVTSFTVTANDSSVIALTVNGEIIGTAMGTGGPVAITIPSQTPGSVMKVTVTRFNYNRYSADVPVVASSYPYVGVQRTLINDYGNGQINPGDSILYTVWAKNMGNGTAQSVWGRLSDTTVYTTMTRDSSWYGNIAQNDSAVSNPPYKFRIANNCPNGKIVNFTLRFEDVNDSVFISYPTVTVYAPVLTYLSVSVVGGNGNGILDPGETANLVVTIRNDGGADAQNVTSTLMENSAYLTISDASGNYGTVTVGASANNAADPYTVTAAAGTPIGTTIPLKIDVVSGIYRDTLDFSLVVGKKHYYLWNPDPTPTPGQNMNTILAALGYAGDYGTTLAADLSYYQAVLVCVGVYANNYVISSSSAEATRLVDYLQNQGGRMYLEGADVWYYDPLGGGYNFCSLFGINATADGTGDVGPVAGQTGTFTNGMNFTGYTGENSYIDHISASGAGAFLIFRDSDNAYDCGVARSVASYRTVGNSFELGLLTDASGVSTRAALLDSIMKFFGCQPNVGAEENLDLLLVGRSLVVFPTITRNRLNIAYNIGKVQSAEGIALRIYDVSGRLIKSFALSPTPLAQCVVWNGDDEVGRQVASGVYFVKLTCDGKEVVNKAVLLR